VSYLLITKFSVELTNPLNIIKGIESQKIRCGLLVILLIFQLVANVFVYELWRVTAQTFPDKNWLWKIRRIFQVWTDQAIAYSIHEKAESPVSLKFTKTIKI
jgi:hypothetical protein